MGTYNVECFLLAIYIEESWIMAKPYWHVSIVFPRFEGWTCEWQHQKEGSKDKNLGYIP